MASVPSSISAVDIDNGTFKYVLIKVTGAPANIETKDNCMYLVRGYARCEYHGKKMRIKY